ncbi:translesion DNA synthesis-associated protein ImuA [Noviherbaspirillum sp. L7-7A]|uniref:translesion DNA synthesis-associated protein ImuA n=1 Tax=Noviherbaspirillum sp. L7-7A TaxID=2850560 RepID=UPI002012C850|nr:translesion DNA synthesis-associated protein ImuA [Noviherbaspirillum sp. L7-7A]
MSGLTLRTMSAAAVSAALDRNIAHSVWRANQMGSCQAAVTATGYASLDRELPNGGWPSSTLIELLLQQAGIGEMRLLKPALCAIGKQRRIVMVQPPHLPQAAAWSHWGLPADRFLWLKTASTADALWSAEQILRNGSCGALLFWQPQIRTEALRRLHLAAQGSTTMFWMLRPLSAAEQASPAPLRLALRPAPAGIAIDIIKRRGPVVDRPVYLALRPDAAPSLTSTRSHHASMDRHALAVVATRSISPALV